MLPQEPDELEDAIARFLALRSALAEGTQKQYRRVLRHFGQVSPDWPPTPEGVAAFIVHCQSRYADDTTHTYFGIVRDFIHFLLRKKYIADDPLEEVSRPKRPKTLPRAPLAENIKKLTTHLETEVEKVLKSEKPKGWRSVRNLALFSLMLDSGLRVSEAANVRLEDVDFLGWTVFVRRGKGNKQREVPLGQITRADLRLWVSYRLLLPIPAGSPGFKHLFVSKRQDWTPMGVGYIEFVLEVICFKVGISPKITPHQLRHAFAVYSHENGANIERIMRWLGHSSLGTTARYLISRGGFKEHLESSPEITSFEGVKTPSFFICGAKYNSTILNSKTETHKRS